MKKYYLLVLLLLVLASGSRFAYAAKPSDYGLKDGDLISAIFSDDPDVYIVNDYGYKRLFLNPEIFKFYGHLGGFFNIKLVTKDVISAFPTSGLFRDCENNDPKVFGVDISGEDTGKLHWVNTTGEQAVKDDSNFFKKVFCINNAEFNWYPKTNALNSVKDVPNYERTTETATTSNKPVTVDSSLKDVGKVIVCHRPSGNPSEVHTITVDASAVKALLAQGDTVGECTSISPTPTPTPTPTPVPSLTPTPAPSLTPTPTLTATPTPTSTPMPTPTATVTPTPTPTPSSTSSVIAPSSVTFGWYKGFGGQPPVGTYQIAISFLYSANVPDVQSFRLYLKKPNESSFSAVATFSSPSSINSTCGGYIYSGTWSMRNCTTSGGGYWQIFSSSGQSSSYPTGEYNAYLVALNSSGAEGQASSTAKNIVSKTTILSPIGTQGSLTPQFSWSVPSSWPGGSFWPQVNDSTVYVWSKAVYSGANTTQGSTTYDGPSLSTSKTYYVNSWAEGNDSSGTRNFSMGDSNPSFTVTASSPTPTPTPTPIPTPLSDVTPPVISPVRVDVAYSSAMASWTALVVWLTDENSTSQVEYGLTSSYGTITPLDSSGAFLRTVHSIILSPEYGYHLASGTTYHYRMISRDASYNTATTTDYTFTTPQSTSQSNFSRDLALGSTGNDVKQLQAFLINEVGYSANLITGYFGRITRDAVIRLQEKYGIKPAYGYFGEITRRTLSALLYH